MVDKVKKPFSKRMKIQRAGVKKKKTPTGTIAKKKTGTIAKKKTGTIAKKKTGTVTTKPKKNTGQTSVTATKPKNKPGTQLATIKSKAKKKPGTLKRLGNVAKRVVRSPVGKFGPLGAAVTGAYFLGEEFFPNKKKKPVAKKPTPKKKAPTKKRKLSPGESKIRKSDIMGGSKGRLSGPQGPLGGKLDKRKKSTVVKNRNKRFNPKKANRAGQKFGQR
mgnify:CR=1 FL=1